MKLFAPSTQEFDSLLRFSRASVATPPWFASPVDAREDDLSITIIFHVPDERVKVEATEETVLVRGRSDAVRLCALPCEIVATGVSATRDGDLLHVRIPKKQPARASPDPTPLDCIDPPSSEHPTQGGISC